MTQGQQPNQPDRDDKHGSSDKENQAPHNPERTREVEKDKENPRGHTV